MSTGISISSINRIKELAEQRKFKEALEILDTQNLEKSINPQFLKISGEIFRENKRYYDCRKILLKAHQMAPQGTRIIQELIQLYLELGYFSKAQKYYEQYTFYVTPEDTQKDYVEYIMKKATGADVKDLAAILIPILERMPEDRWNFEAILLYDKMDRKDMALEESRYILENFKESEYVQPVIDYIDDKLDIDKWFCVYPKEEQPEDTELFADLIELEEKILEADHLRMYPPEARIMVEADDNDADEVAPVKEKKPKKTRGLFKKNSKNAEEVVDGESNDNVVANDAEEKNVIEKSSDTESNRVLDDSKNTTEDKSADTSGDISKIDDKLSSDVKHDDDKSSVDNTDMKSDDISAELTSEDKQNEKDDATDELSLEEQVQQEREAALEKILSKKLDKDKIKESAKQVAKAVKEIDTDKAKKQVKSVAATVKDNVRKATDVIGGAVGTKVATEQLENIADNKVIPDEELIMDGIIEGILEPPKKAVGEVVVNEELDAIIPDSLEAMSEQEVADREARKEEIERLELEALETTLKLEEEKKAKRQARLKFGNNEADSDEEVVAVEEHVSSENTSNEIQERIVDSEDSENDTTSLGARKVDSMSSASREQESGEVLNDEQADNLTEVSATHVDISFTSDNSSYAELKNRFMKEMEDDKPLESLGFMTVVHSDVDAAMEEAMPDAAGMLRQMIGNKEYYAGENSLGFESEASYLNHGFEIEDCDFDTYRKQLDAEHEGEVSEEQNADTVEVDTAEEEVLDDAPAVQEIFAQESVVEFEEVAEEPEIEVLAIEDTVAVEPEMEELVIEDTMAEQPVLVEEPVFEEPKVEESVIEDMITEQSVFVEEPVVEQSVFEQPVFVEEVQEPIYEEMVEELVVEDIVAEEPKVEESVIEDTITEQPVFVEEPVVEQSVFEQPVFVEEVQEPIYGEMVEELVVEDTTAVEPKVEESVSENIMAERPVFVEESVFGQESIVFTYNNMVPEVISGVETVVETELDLRAHLRANIILSTRMENILQELKGK